MGAEFYQAMKQYRYVSQERESVQNEADLIFLSIRTQCIFRHLSDNV